MGCPHNQRADHYHPDWPPAPAEKKERKKPCDVFTRKGKEYTLPQGHTLNQHCYPIQCTAHMNQMISPWHILLDDSSSWLHRVPFSLGLLLHPSVLGWLKVSFKICMWAFFPRRHVVFRVHSQPTFIHSFIHKSPVFWESCPGKEQQKDKGSKSRRARKRAWVKVAMAQIVNRPPHASTPNSQNK